MKQWVKDFFNLIYPQLCIGCESVLSTGEQLLCTSCHLHLPLTNFHKTSDQQMRQLFIARIEVVHLVSLLYYEKIGTVQHMIHQLKYRGRKEIGPFLGAWLAQELKDHKGFKDVDLIVPVPVHPKRFKKRGYNQVSGFGKELARFLGIRFRESVIIKTRNTKKQAQLNQSQRSDESNSPYLLNQTIPDGSHVLLVDDIITTGTTLVLCARELQKIPNVKISIATMAISV